MQRRPNMLLIVALLAVCSMPASAAGFRKQAQLRISMTIVDSCEVALAGSGSGTTAEARVQCSTFMPHQSTSAELRTQSADPGLTTAESRTFLALAPPAYLAALSPHDALRGASGRVTVATVIF